MLNISIIVPVYNVEHYLRQCLDSLLVQTWKDFELICIDDGSTDSSLSILKEYELRDRRIRVIAKENEGYGKTVNRGLKEARAPYIGIVESDDFVKPEMYERLYETMKAQSADVVKCNFYKYRAGNEMDADYSHEYQEALYGQILEPIDYPSLYSAHSSVWAALYSRQFLEENQIYFNETPGASYQDVAFQFKILSSAKKMIIIQEALLYYRTDNLMSSVNSPNKIYCIFDEIHCMEEYVKKQAQERQEKLWPILQTKKYYEYRWHCWERLSPMFRFSFFEKMIAEFKEDQAARKFAEVTWHDPNEKKEFEGMMDNPKVYFMGRMEQYQDERIYSVNTINQRFKEIGFSHIVKTAENIVIYGAGKVGRFVAEKLQAVGIEREKLLFVVTKVQEKESIIDGIPVRQIDEVMKECSDELVLVAVKGEKQIVMLNYLKDLGCRKIIVVDDKIMGYLQNPDCFR